MRRSLSLFSLCIFLTTSLSPSAFALEEETVEQMVEAGQKLNELIDKFKDMELEKYNQTVATVKDQNGNPADCTVRIYYNDYQQEKFATSGGSFDGVFNHGAGFPTKVISVHVDDCTCRVTSVGVNGPTFPYLNEEMERLKKLLEEEIGEQITDTLSEKAEEQVKKGLEKVMEGLGMGAEAAAGFMQGFAIGAKLGAPIGEFITKKVQEIQDALKKEAESYHREGEHAPLRPNVNLTKEGWTDWVARGLGFGSWNTPLTKFQVDITVMCTAGFQPNYYNDGHWVAPLKPRRSSRSSSSVSSRSSVSSQPGTRASSASSVPAPASAPSQTQSQASEPSGIDEDVPPPPERKSACPLCDPILKAIAAKEAEIAQIKLDIQATQTEKQSLDAEKSSAEKDVQAAKDALNRFDNPQSWAESEGRRVTSTDLEIQREAMSEAWEKYRSGEWNAQQLEDYWQNFNPADRDALKEKARERLQRDIRDAEERLKEIQNRAQALDAKIAAMDAAIGNLIAEIAALHAHYEECLKLCMAGEEIDVYEKFQIQAEPEPGWMCGWFGLFCGDDEEAVMIDDDAVVSSVSSSVSSMQSSLSTASSVKNIDDDGSATKGSFSDPEGLEAEVPVIDYRAGNEDTKSSKAAVTVSSMISESIVRSSAISSSQKSSSKSSAKSSTAAVSCRLPSMKLGDCEDSCEEDGGSCVASEKLADGTQCYKCEEKKVAKCPSGTITDQAACNEQCSNGACVVSGSADGVSCYSCVKCPSGTYNSESACDGSCDTSCSVATSQGSLQCFQCQKSCTELCDAQGFSANPVDHGSYIESYLNGYSCVSAATISIETLTTGGCECYSKSNPSISIDSTVPVCRGSTCGDIACGQSATCGENPIVTVHCNWGGWRKVDMNQYQPMVGQ